MQLEFFFADTWNNWKDKALKANTSKEYNYYLRNATEALKNI